MVHQHNIYENKTRFHSWEEVHVYKQCITKTWTHTHICCHNNLKKHLPGRQSHMLHFSLRKDTLMFVKAHTFFTDKKYYENFIIFWLLLMFNLTTFNERVTFLFRGIEVKVNEVLNITHIVLEECKYSISEKRYWHKHEVFINNASTGNGRESQDLTQAWKIGVVVHTETNRYLLRMATVVVMMRSTYKNCKSPRLELI